MWRQTWSEDLVSYNKMNDDTLCILKKQTLKLLVKQIFSVCLLYIVLWCCFYTKLSVLLAAPLYFHCHKSTCWEKGTLHFIIQLGQPFVFFFFLPFYSSTLGRVPLPLYVKHMQKCSGFCLYYCWVHSWYRGSLFVLTPRNQMVLLYWTDRFSKCRSDSA